jgi:hypothetical protein
VSAWSVGGGGCPDEAGELAGAGDDSDVAGLAASAHPLVDAVQTMLGAVGDLSSASWESRPAGAALRVLIPSTLASASANVSSVGRMVELLAGQPGACAAVHVAGCG